MKIYDTSEVDLQSLPQREIDYIYNGLDCCITHELVDKLTPKLDTYTSQIHDFTSSLQNICLDMTLSGILIDQQAKSRIVRETTKKLDEAQSLLDSLAEALWGKPLNPKSPKQCQEFFYGFLGLPPIYKRGSKGPTTDDAALEQLQTYFWARPFISLIKTVRDYKKKLEALNAKISPDGRMRGQFKATGTETGRFSSSKNVFNEGLNLQNQNEFAKRMYVADPGYKLAYIDLEQAESRMLAAFIYGLFGDSSYLDACESGDLHTTVCMMIWPDLQWTSDPKANRAIADTNFYRHFSHRDMSKRGGHGTNYYGKPAQMAKNLNVSPVLMTNFQESYFSAFPGIPEYHEWVIRTLQTTRTLINPFGRKRIFFGRPSDDSTIREAIAYMPQSSIGDLMNLGMWKVWKKYGRQSVQLLAQVHDAILFQFPESLEHTLIPDLLNLIPHPLQARDREVWIPCTAETGWNWAHIDPKKRLWPDTNPDGLKEYTGNDTRQRGENPKKANSILDRVLF
ncbi:DNA polymerase [Idiomarina abyssalis]|uniref:DNA polymerase n=1 Tax=Idiomarina abyssalis TaxID=86102 RepID=UPI003A8F6C40